MLTRAPGARPGGMGGAFTAVADDANAAAWNPAGLSLARRGGTTYSRQGFAGTHLDSAGFTRPLGGHGGLGGQFAWAHDSQSALKAGLAASGPLGDSVYAGAGASLARVAEGDQSSATALFDAGVMAPSLPGLLWSASVQNLSAGRLVGPPPTVLRLGSALRFADAGFSDLEGLLAAAEIDYARERKLGDLAVGAEYHRRPWAFRAGLIAGPKAQTEGRRITLGFGYRSGDVSWDYAYAPAKGYGDSHRFSVGVGFGAVGERPGADYLERMDTEDEPGPEGTVFRIEPRLAAAEEHLRAGRPNLALRELDAADRLVPAGDDRAPRVDEARGRALEAMADPEAARKAFIRGVERARRGGVRGELLADLYAGMGRTLLRQKNAAYALKFFEAALEEGPPPAHRREIEDRIAQLKFGTQH